MAIRAGMVRATFKIRIVFICDLSMPSVCAITIIKGAWLNHTTKVIKKAIQVMWRILIFPEKENRLSFWDDMVGFPL